MNFNDGIRPRFDRWNDIENAVKGYYNTNDIYMFRCGNDITNIPGNYYYLRNTAADFNQALANAKKLVTTARQRFNSALKKGNGELKYGNHISSYISKNLENEGCCHTQRS
ncbi:hypothetical protein ABK905_11950 [Acerihabitans sp. KWT182]|uniref:Uncharacterized protein n=1 Tax=Acerihabitans sp. KWT182 TaxID=3157919 RepID=A0AAU7QF61_9GAMM